MALFFHSDDVDQIIAIGEAVQITEGALRDMTTPEGVCAPRKRLNLHRNVAEGAFDTVLNIYAGGSANYGAVGAQVALHRKAIVGNQQKRPSFNPDQTELALIYDSDTGSLLGVMAHRRGILPAWPICARRRRVTAGLDRFARKDACRVGIYGSGQQAWATFAGLCQMRKIENAKVFSPTPAHREGFAKKISARTGVAVKPVEAPELAAKDVDIILCMTNTNVPVLDGPWLEEGQYIISVVGSNIELVKSGNLAAPRRESDDGTLKRCDFIVALSKAQAIDSQQGDIYWPAQAGVISWDKVVEIADVLAGKVKGRTDDKQIILYKNQGGKASSTLPWRKVLRTRQTTWQGLCRCIDAHELVGAGADGNVVKSFPAQGFRDVRVSIREVRRMKSQLPLFFAQACSAVLTAPLISGAQAPNFGRE
jgi:ornithine cyclodeaminase/alanine dehydrogenase-like protein (mu-crystallin family)